MAQPLTGLPVLMGVVNVTPDSFSDGGRWDTTDAAIAHGRDLLADGADILDIGGESTRPGATRPLVEEELGTRGPGDPRAGRRRCRRLGRHHARRGGRRGARRRRHDRQRRLGRPGRPADPRRGRGLRRDVRLHALACPQRPDDRLRGVRRSRRRARRGARRAERARSTRPARPAYPTSGSSSTRAWASPRSRRTTGVCSPGSRCSSRSASGSWSGPAASRSSARCSPAADGEPRPVDDRENATTALTVLLAQQRVWGLRVHDVRASRDALRTFARGRRADGGRAVGDRDRVLRPPRGLRAREARGSGVRRRPRARHRHPSRRPRPTTCTTRWTTEVSWRT